MIGGLFFLASIVAIFIVLNWFKDNDGIPQNEPTKGLLAMRLSDPDEMPKQARRWTREAARR